MHARGLNMPTHLPLLPVILIVILGAIAAPAQSTASDNVILGAVSLINFCTSRLVDATSTGLVQISF